MTNMKKFCKKTTKKIVKIEKKHPVATTAGVGVIAANAAYSLSYPVRRAALAARIRLNNKKIASAAKEVVKDLQAETQDQTQTQQ